MRSQLLAYIGCVCLLHASLKGVSSLSSNDPYPVYSALYDPQMSTYSKEGIAGFRKCSSSELFSFSISGFFQKARSGRTFDHQRAYLGDLQGASNILALLYGNRLSTANYPNNSPLGYAENTIFSSYFATQNANMPNATIPILPSATYTGQSIPREFVLDDVYNQIGYVSLPIKYRKMGARLELDFHPFEDIGLTIQAGVSEIRQTVTGFINLSIDQTCPLGGTGNATGNDMRASGTNFCADIPQINQTGNSYLTCDPTNPSDAACTTPLAQIYQNLLDPMVLRTIIRQIGLDDCNFERTSFEDVRLSLWWRHIFAANFADPCSYAPVLVIPFVQFNVIAPAAHKKDRTKLLALPFGNDGFTAIGGDAGIAFDFIETIEVSFGGGMQYFFGRDVDHYRLPTSVYQSGIFPFATKVHVKPGYSFNANASLWAYRFYDRFSAWVEWVYVKHEQDHIRVIDRALAPLFLVDRAECTTKFISQMVNASLSYEISPCMSLGVLGQFPVMQRNAYRSTTWMGTFKLVF